MRDLLLISEKDVLSYAMKGICESIIRAPFDELGTLNAQFEEMYQRQKKIIADEGEAPF